MICSVFIRNKIFLIIFPLLPLFLKGQDVKVIHSERIARDIPGDLFPAAVSPDGKHMLITDPGYRGLILYDITDGKSTQVSTEAGAGYKPAFSASGEKLWYRSDVFSGLMKYSDMHEYDIPAAQSRIIENRTRNLSPPLVVNDHVVYSVDGRRKTDPETSKGDTGGVYAVLEDLVPVVYINGIRKILKPNGEGNYIWLSLSPDKTKLLYNHLGKTTYVCDLDGRILAEAGRINAPQWLNNQIIIGMNDRDDGYRVLSSDIICYSIKTKLTSNLTNSSGAIEMYPLPFPDGKRVVYQTIKGELYIMDLRIK